MTNATAFIAPSGQNFDKVTTLASWSNQVTMYRAELCRQDVPPRSESLRSGIAQTMQPVLIRRLSNVDANSDSEQRSRLLHPQLQQQWNDSLHTYQQYADQPLLLDFYGLCAANSQPSQQLQLMLALCRLLEKAQQQQLVFGCMPPLSVFGDAKAQQLYFFERGQHSQLHHINVVGHQVNTALASLQFMAPEATGRIHTPMDQRTDLYCLGLLFYTLLCGKPPFTEQDALSLIHAHIALPAPDLRQVAPQTPQVLSLIVQHLLAKAPEQRYQSLQGLITDLQRCQQQLQQSGQLPATLVLSVQLGRQGLQFPEQLFGRQQALQQLEDAYQDIRQHNRRVVLLQGASGLGKTALVEQLHQRHVGDNCYFVQGKFEQYQEDTLYTALRQALTQLAEQVLLTQSEAQLQQLQQQLGDGDALLPSLVPALQPLYPNAREPQQASIDARLDVQLRHLLRLLGRQAPLVLFFDDLQWADASSLRVLHQLLTDQSLDAVLLLLAYRDNEVGADHPLAQLLEQLYQAQVPLQAVGLQPLQVADCLHLLSTVLQYPSEQLSELAAVLQQQSGGNPLEIRQTLQHWLKQHWLFTDASGSWQWQAQLLSRPAAHQHSLNQLKQQWQQSDERCRHLLKLSAVLGEHAYSDVLMHLLDLSYPEFEQLLAPLVQQNILRAFTHGRGMPIQQIRFSHDRLQQTAYSLADHEPWQLKIAGYYLRHKAEPLDHLFKFIQHLDQAGPAAVVKFGADEVFAYNEAAAKAAMHIHAWHNARHYDAYALSLTEDLQKTTPVALFYCRLRLATAMYLTQDYAAALTECEVLHQQASNTLGRMQVVRLQVLILYAQHNFAPAYPLASQVLLEAGIDINQYSGIASRYLQLPGLSALKDPQQIGLLLQRPEVLSEQHQLAMEILNVLLTIAYMLSPEHYLMVSSAMLDVSLRYGHSAVASKAYSSHAMNLAGAFGDFKGAMAFADLALAVNQQFAGRFAPELNFQRAATVLHYNAPLAQSIESLEQNVHQALELGNPEFAVHSALFHGFYSLLAGTPLGEVAALMARHRRLISDKNFPYNLSFIRLWQQYALALQDSDLPTARLQGEAFAEDSEVALLAETQNLTQLFAYQLIKMMQCMLFRQDNQAWQHYQAALPLEMVALGLYHRCELHFYAALLCQRLLLPSTEQAPQPDRQSLQNSFQQHYQTLAVWAQCSPANHGYKIALLDAMSASIAGAANSWQLFDEAIAQAMRSGFVQHLALAQEEAANYWQQQGKTALAQDYQQQAILSYSSWQAFGKVRQLQQQQPQKAALNSGQQLLDLASVLKAAETLSGQADPQIFLRRMLQLMAENAGAQQGALFLGEAPYSTPIVTLPADRQQWPLNLLQFVSRSKKPRVFRRDEPTVLMAQDACISTLQPASMMGIPLLIADKLRGVLYLEHHELVGAFPAERLHLLQLLANQTAILFENTRLYQQVLEANKTLEQNVADRTAELATALAKAEDATNAKSAFLARMSHEIRTPINAVIGLSRLAAKTQLDMEQKDYVSKILESGEVLLSLINDILDFSKIEAGKLQLEQTRFTVASVLKRSINLSALKAHAKGVELIAEIDEQMPAELIGDPLRLQQILVNLLSNAVKFTEHGFIHVKLAATVNADGSATLDGSVTDTGIGMTPEQQQQLFKSFSQGDTSITRKYGGTGLGLSICQQLCEMMQGQIWVESEAGKGSSFHFRLQLAVVPPSADNVSAAPSVRQQLQQAGNNQSLGKLRALVVDDIALSRHVLCALLGSFGISTDESCDGISAIAQVSEAVAQGHPYDVVLMDWRMPDMDGIETTRYIQQRFGSASPAILMVSAYDRELARQQLNEVQIARFIEKPVDPSMLFDAIVHLHHESAGTLNSGNGLPNWQGYRILLVEDHAINRQVALGLLKDTGVEILVAENGRRALDFLQQDSVDLVLMDIQMPEMDGLTATRLLRSQLQLTQLPVIAMTAHAMASDIEKSLQAGMNGHICKPIEPAELYQTINKWLPRQSVSVIVPSVSTPAAVLVNSGHSSAKINSDAGAPNVAEPTKAFPHAQSTDYETTAESLPIDAARAIRQLGGNQALYQQLVLDFMRDQQAQIDRLGQLMARQDVETLQREVHSLKSVSAYIGAFQISQLCSTLEQNLAQGAIDAAEISRLQQQLQQLMAYLLASAPTQPTQQKNVAQACPLQQVWQQLYGLLQESDFAAEQLIQQTLQRADLPPRLYQQLTQLATLVDAIEFEQAAELTKQWLENDQAVDY